MRWFLLALTLAIFWLALSTRSPGWMGLGLLVGLVMCFVTAVAFAAKRIEARAQREVYVPTPAELELLRRRAERQKAERQTGAGDRGAEGPRTRS